MVFAAGVFGAICLATWSTRRAAERAPASGQNLASELVWGAIPCLTILAATILAVMAIAAARAVN
jgi:heme/copper-type cytochrome/quinol oxidase subunit 2